MSNNIHASLSKYREQCDWTWHHHVIIFCRHSCTLRNVSRWQEAQFWRSFLVTSSSLRSRTSIGNDSLTRLKWLICIRYFPGGIINWIYQFLMVMISQIMKNLWSHFSQLKRNPWSKGIGLNLEFVVSSAWLNIPKHLFLCNVSY